MADSQTEPEVDEHKPDPIDLANESQLPKLLIPIEQCKRKDRSKTNTPSPCAAKPTQPEFKEIPNSSPGTAEKFSRFKAVFNSSTPGSVERISRKNQSLQTLLS